MTKLPYMQFYPSDWLADCQILSLAARGAWQTIICKAWHPSCKGVVTLSMPSIGRLLGCPIGEAKEVLQELKELDIAGVEFEGEGVTVTCRRVAREWEKAAEKHQKAVESGKRGAAKRWPPHKEPHKEPHKGAHAFANGIPEPEPEPDKEREREGSPSEEDCIKFSKESGPKLPAQWRDSWARSFHAVWEERSWTTNTGNRLLDGQKWKHRLKGDLETAARNGEHKGGQTSGRKTGAKRTASRNEGTYNDPSTYAGI